MENYSRDAASFDDLVLSSVHVESEHQRRILDQNFSVTKFKFDVVDQSLANREQYVGLCYDEEGDIIVHRGDDHVIKEEQIVVYHCMATPLADVGKQLWLGALLLGDWILHNPSLFKDTYCLELGAGTGLCSMLAGIYCKHIFCTDAGDSVLELCQKNVDENENLLKYGKTGIKVKELNWMCDNFSYSNNNDECRKFDWTSDEISELKKTEIFLAADVIYDNTLTEGLFCKLISLMEKSEANETKLFISIEKRINFTIDELDVSCPAYRYFRKMLGVLECGRFPSSSRIHRVQRLDLTFPQYFDYKRIKQLELWQVTSEKI